MKLNICLGILSLGVLALAGISGCEKESSVPLGGQDLQGILTNKSDCKSNKSATLTGEYGNNVSCISYTYSPETKKLTLKHINAGFNCCPGTVSCNFQSSGDTLIVSESESSSLCSCNCLYDLDMEVSGIESCCFILKINEPYLSGQEPLVFPIDLDKKTTGEYCVERDHYPWGI